jgi:hypothetical protein
MTRSLRRIDWAALGASLGSTVLFTLLLLSPFLWGRTTSTGCSGWPSGSSWASTSTCAGTAYDEPGPDADETRFPR